MVPPPRGGQRSTSRNPLAVGVKGHGVQTGPAPLLMRGGEGQVKGWRSTLTPLHPAGSKLEKLPCEDEFGRSKVEELLRSGVEGVKGHPARMEGGKPRLFLAGCRIRRTLGSAG